MRQRSFSVLGSLYFLLLLGASVQGQEYQRPTPGPYGGPPTTADLVTYDGASTTLTVQLLNLTPYDIQFDHNPGVTWSITSADEAAMEDQDRLSPKSFMFAPIAVPTLIPAAPAQDFLDPGDPGYDPNYVDTTTHPYSMVFAWDDHGGVVVDNWAKWIVKGVSYTTSDGVVHSQDVNLGLWIYRNNTAATLTSGYLPTLVNSLKAVFGALAIPVQTTDPLSWSEEYLASRELAAGPTEFAKENTLPNDGHKMWIASYVIPSRDSVCAAGGLGCNPTSMKPADTGDAVYSDWYYLNGGEAERNLVVSVHLLRGQKAPQCAPLLYPNVCPLGSEPVVMITVMRPDDFALGTMVGDAPDSSVTLTANNTPTDPVRLFLLQAGAGSIRELLLKQGRPGLLALRSIVYGLDPAQQQVLLQMVQTMGSGRLPTQQERQLVHLIAQALKEQLQRCCSPAAGAGSQ